MILVTGGTGTTGVELLKELSRRGVTTRAFVRKRSQEIDLPGVEQVLGDLERPETIPPALDGVQSALLLTSPGEHSDRLQINFVEGAARAGLPHLVRFSALGSDPDSPSRLLRQHAGIDKGVQRSGIPYTFLRPAQFMQNFLASRESILGRGEFYAPQGDGRIDLVDVRDVAAVAARVLTEAGHAGKTYDITGPEAIAYSRVADSLSNALRRPVRYVNITPDAYRQMLIQFGLPRWTADGILELYDIWRNNGATVVTNVVAEVGRKTPYTIDDFARDYAPVFLGHAAAGG